MAKRLRDDPITGNDHVTKDLWKVRMAITDKGKGERGSARVIIEVKIVDNEVYVLSVYDKGDTNDLTDKELKRLLNAPKPSARTTSALKSQAGVRKKKR